MTTTVAAYAAPSGGAPLEKTSIDRRDVGAHDVLIEIEYAGICHSDIHTVRDEWGKQTYPLTPGHEIIGHVKEVGSDVTRHQVGDAVGVGCMVNSCQECEACTEGLEQYCVKGNIGTYGVKDKDGTITQGGYSTHVVVDERFVVHVPDGIDHAAATPLLCAGITLYSPLRHWEVGPGSKVAIIGMGGLGHVGVKIAAAMGAEVTVLSHSLAKKDDGLRFGAKNYVATTDEDAMKALRGTFDLIINTVSVNLPMDDYLALLRFDGVLVELGAPSKPLSVQAFSLIGMRKSLAGSCIGGIAETQEMLDFCAEHGITAEIEQIGADAINEAYERVVDSDVRYRFVIDASTF
ncbi:NAD(P)-dependent alcohol dehydrogenase [Arsenicicoccus piscis]|uniref:alcohol dehydrogenase (NADP(+)) n=1 Tax=Arsenicicoccus piscis TaxID=673954 RepID=A0ABQ6HLF1_9MICO|nr:NAD(P)-dependent alcohol dehydrogenase [Arsenicicoccus piscis]MCH8628184.1 NAD(P)-dependent alcohol dehydrogenase [Arsenicicoccus piscis]GMA18420.1 NADP-dependent alcohol dehydrogenase C [Arsenicicoccus piscis]